MVQYNPKDWITFIFKLHKSDTFRKLLPLMFFIGIYTAIICYVEIDYYQLKENNQIKNTNIMHSMLGFVISLLLAYRTNTAYERWWEGRKLWGSLVNNSRNLAIKLNVILEIKEDKHFFRILIPQYARVLANYLRNEEVSLLLYENTNLNITKTKHAPNQVAHYIFEKINLLYKQKKIDGAQLQIINQEFQALTDVCGACERIKNTPIPYSYSAFIKKFIFIYIMTLPYSYVFSLGYYAVPVVVFIFYVLASLELIAEEIEDPFGTDANDLPVLKIASNIKKNVEDIIVE
jgi:ion channel-forming bestrophin family protein